MSAAPGFGPLTAIHVLPSSPGPLVLVAEFEGLVDEHEAVIVPFSYCVIGLVATPAEAQEAVTEDMARRRDSMEDGEDTACPDAYAVWGRNGDGYFVRLEEILP